MIHQDLNHSVQGVNEGFVCNSLNNDIFSLEHAVALHSCQLILEKDMATLKISMQLLYSYLENYAKTRKKSKGLKPQEQ